MKDIILYKTEWLSLRKLVDKPNGVNGYIYSHEDRCNGKIISILPFRYKNNQIEFLLRKEITPPWGMESKISSITGGVENNKIIPTVIEEMKEEAGYEISQDDLIYLGTFRGTKSSDTLYYLYSVDLTNKNKTLDASGDGSELEKLAECYWDTTIENAVDPFVYVAHYHLMKLLPKIK